MAKLMPHSRRRFLQLTSAAPAALLAPSLLPAAVRAAEGAPKKVPIGLELYSVRGELASAVLVVPLEAKMHGTPALGGMVTISQKDDLASIGLIAVASQMRGLGLGSHLLRAAHNWMRAHGAVRAQVATQLDNTPACRLYQQGGYQVDRIQPYYHFWL